MMDKRVTNDLQASYDRLAEEYAARIYAELAHKPLDRELLDRFAEGVRGHGPVCDVGCGPGHVARYLHERGVEVFGLDLSLGMVEQARRLNPGLTFRQGDLLALEDADNVWGGAAAFYSLIHIPPDQIVNALRELHRVVRPGGLLLVAFHVGQEVRHLDELWGLPVNMDFLFFEPHQMSAWLLDAGFVVEEIVERAPYPDVEAQTQRAYIFARKPD
jgi:SAM-dependent methyltransferase